MQNNEKTTLTKPAEATLRIPIDSRKNAEIAYKVLNVDSEPRRNFVQKKLRVVCLNEDSTYLEVNFTADQVKNLRTSITSFFESLFLCTDTIKEFASA